MVTERTNRVWPDVAIPPGELLRETVEALGMTQAELARRTGRPTQTINDIIQGRTEITPETALQLEKALGSPAYLWLGLEKDYRFNKARLAELRRLNSQASMLAAFPIREMVKFGWIERHRDKARQVKELLEFLGIASFDELRRVQPAAYRKSRLKEASPTALAAWLRRGELLAHRIETAPFDERKLKGQVGYFRSLTLKPPEEFQQELRETCAQCGVAWVMVPHLPKTYVNGATRWMGEKAVIQMSLRFKTDDIFWFTFFHELGHILLHGRREQFVDHWKGDGGTDAAEQEADRFAANQLISPSDYRKLPVHKYLSKNEVRNYAAEIGVAPGIIVGRLQHDGKLSQKMMNDLKRKFEFRQQD
ncbi:MAG: addiction module antidote protein, HigA family [Planctomycetales bacterium 4484_113]|nr:MAG: addiction module antidote protein, HigA family [Planctomycetales bacterium 4484_113]